MFYAQKPFKIGGISDPLSESAIAQQTISDKLPYGGSQIYILYKSNRLSVTDITFKNAVEKSLNGLKKFHLKHRIISPYENPQQIAKNNHAAYAVVSFDANADQVAESIKGFYRSLGKPANLKMYVGGQPIYIVDVDRLSQQNLIRGELIALPLCLIALLIIFRGVIAALLPIISGVLSIIIILAILYMLGNLFDLSIFVVNIATMLGLGLTLDYTLIITYRYREEIALGYHCPTAIIRTMETAGRAVLFSGLTVLISMSLLLFFPMDVLFSIGVGGVVVVIVSVLCALSFLPAMLCLLDSKVNAWPIHLWRINHTAETAHTTLWYRSAIMIMKHPFLFIIPTIIFLLCLGYPFVNVKLSRSDASVLPITADSRKTLEQFKDNYAANKLTPIEILLKSKNRSILTSENIGYLYDYSARIKKMKGVESISSIVSSGNLTKKQYQMLYSQNRPLDKYHQIMLDQTTKGRYTVISVMSKYDDNDERSSELVKKIRQKQIGHGMTQMVTGSTATMMDTIDYAYNLFFKTIIAISFITYFVLLVLLRSIFLPLKAIMMNFLSLCVCYGMLVFIFQEGHFAHFLHFKSQNYTDLTLPILLFFGLFGLSMDYEVFLLTRIKEFYDSTHDNNLSVALGLERSGRIITSAALIVVIVAGAYVTADIIFIKAFGLGTALAVAIDASIIRILLVPATMSLLGKWNWYLPKWLDKILPNIKLD